MSHHANARPSRVRRAVAAIAACVAAVFPLLLAGSGSARAAGRADASSGTRADESLREPIVFGQVPARATSDGPAVLPGLSASAGLPAGSRIVAFDPTNPDHGIVNLTPDFNAAGRPDISFDGKRILFVGRRTREDRLNVWEMNLDGTAARRITDRPKDCLAALYLSTIYTIDADAPVYQIAFLSSEETGRTLALYTCRLDGTRTAQITFNPYGVFDPWQLSDGRLLYSSRLAPTTGRHSIDPTVLFTVMRLSRPAPPPRVYPLSGSSPLAP